MSVRGRDGLRRGDHAGGASGQDHGGGSDPPGGCPDERALLAYRAQALSPEREAEIDEHLLGCQRCRDLLLAHGDAARAGEALRRGELDDPAFHALRAFAQRERPGARRLPPWLRWEQAPALGAFAQRERPGAARPIPWLRWELAPALVAVMAVLVLAPRLLDRPQGLPSDFLPVDAEAGDMGVGDPADGPERPLIAGPGTVITIHVPHPSRGEARAYEAPEIFVVRADHTVFPASRGGILAAAAREEGDVATLTARASLLFGQTGGGAELWAVLPRAGEVYPRDPSDLPPDQAWEVLSSLRRSGRVEVFKREVDYRVAELPGQEGLNLRLHGCAERVAAEPELRCVVDPSKPLYATVDLGEGGADVALVEIGPGAAPIPLTSPRTLSGHGGFTLHLDPPAAPGGMAHIEAWIWTSGRAPPLGPTSSRAQIAAARSATRAIASSPFSFLPPLDAWAPEGSDAFACHEAWADSDVLGIGACEDALQQVSEGADRRAEAVVTGWLVYLLFFEERPDLPRAQRLAEGAAAWARDARETSLLLSALRLQAFGEGLQADAEAALTTLDEALNVAYEEGDDVEILRNHVEMAQWLRALRRLDESGHHLDQAVAAAERLEDPALKRELRRPRVAQARLSRSYEALAPLLEELRPEAESAYEAVSRGQPAPGEVLDVVSLMTDVGLMEYSLLEFQPRADAQGVLDVSERWYGRARALDEAALGGRSRDDILYYDAQLYAEALDFAQGDTAPLRQRFNQRVSEALASDPSLDRDPDWLNLRTKVAIRSGDIAEAQRLYDRLRAAPPSGDSHGGSLQRRHAELLARAGRGDAAASAVEEALAAFEAAALGQHLTPSALVEALDDEPQMFAFAQDLLLSLGRVDEAFAVAERQRYASRLRQHLAEAAEGWDPAEARARSEEAYALRRALAEGGCTTPGVADRSRQCPPAMRAWRAFERSALQEALAGRRAIPAPPVSAREVGAQLRPGEALLAFSVADARLVAYRITPRGGLRQRSLGHRPFPNSVALSRALGDEVTQWTDALRAARGEGQASRAPLPPLLTEIAATLAWALDGGGVERLIVVPFGPTHHAPWAALPVDAAPAIQGVEVVEATSATAWVAQRRRPRAVGPAPRVLAVANPLGNLEISSAEARAFSPPGATVLDGEAATWGAVLGALPQHDVLFYSGHGQAWGFAGAENALILNGKTPLVPDDLAYLGRAPAVVILSGCETGVGRLHRADQGGLVDAFLAAGAQTVLTTLWGITPGDGSALLSQLFSDLPEGGWRASAAWRDAVLKGWGGQIPAPDALRPLIASPRGRYGDLMARPTWPAVWSAYALWGGER